MVPRTIDTVPPSAKPAARSASGRGFLLRAACRRERRRGHVPQAGVRPPVVVLVQPRRPSDRTTEGLPEWALRHGCSIAREHIEVLLIGVDTVAALAGGFLQDSRLLKGFDGLDRRGFADAQ